MIYLGTASSRQAREAMAAGQLGQMMTPGAGNRLVEGVTWAGDNGCFAETWTPDRWWSWVQKRAQLPGRCLFMVCPDVVGDAEATAERWRTWAPRMRELGQPVAWVAQNGATPESIPPDADVVFIGGVPPYEGAPDWKDGPEAAAIAAEAKRRGMWVHMGRVNTRRRLVHAWSIGCDSVDGTTIARGPDRNLPPLLRWLADLEQRLPFPITPPDTAVRCTA